MSYTPTNWKAGDTVTSAKLNKMEQGIADGMLVVRITTEDGATFTMDKTWQQIYNANFAVCVIRNEENGAYAVQNIPIFSVQGIEGEGYMVMINLPSDTPIPNTFSAENPDDYPTGERTTPTPTPT